MAFKGRREKKPNQRREREVFALGRVAKCLEKRAGLSPEGHG